MIQKLLTDLLADSTHLTKTPSPPQVESPKRPVHFSDLERLHARVDNLENQLQRAVADTQLLRRLMWIVLLSTVFELSIAPIDLLSPPIDLRSPSIQGQEAPAESE